MNLLLQLWWWLNRPYHHYHDDDDHKNDQNHIPYLVQQVVVEVVQFIGINQSSSSSQRRRRQKSISPVVVVPSHVQLHQQHYQPPPPPPSTSTKFRIIHSQQQQSLRLWQYRPNVVAISYLLLLFIFVVTQQQQQSPRTTPILYSTAFVVLQSSSSSAAAAMLPTRRTSSSSMTNGSSLTTKTTTTTTTATTRRHRFYAIPNDTNNNNEANDTASLSLVKKTKQLHQYTIKELRDMIITYTTATTATASDNNTNNNDEKRLPMSSSSSSSSTVVIAWSKLKRKQDYVDYLLQLQQHQQIRTMTDAKSSTSTSISPIQPLLPVVPLPTKVNVIVRKPSTHQQQLSMPPMMTTTKTNQNHYQSPKDIIVEEVYQRYPPLRPQQQLLLSSLSNPIPTIQQQQPQPQPLDVRQEYHPVMRQLALLHGSNGRCTEDDDDDTQIELHDDTDIATATASTDESTNTNSSSSNSNNNNNIMVQSDMDIVCIGTASCTPGITRGVSCTAIRCNWNRRSSTSTSTSNTLSSSPNGLNDLSSSTGMNSSVDFPPTLNTINGNDNNNNLQNNNNNNNMNGAISTFQAGTWIFDVGECTQLQIQKTTSVKPGKITKIFLTHAHGDHTFGLPGLLCLMGQDRSNDAPVVDIYGPEGLRMWLRTAIRYSVSRIVPPYRVHEIMNIPMAPPWEYNPRSRRYYYKGAPETAQWNVHKGLAGEDMTNWISQSTQIAIEPSTMYGEMDGGRSIYPTYNHPQSVNGAPIWLIEADVDVEIYAAPMSHGIPCVGYVIQEQPRAGRLRNEYVEPIVQRNKAALVQSGYIVPMRALAVIKNLPIGATFTFPDGTIVRQEDAVEPERTGRKIVICGDTSCAMTLSKLAYQADVIIHEATNAYLTGVDTKDATLSQVTRDAIIHGHSTPQMAAKFCSKVQGQILLMNHFSARYKGDPSVDSLSIMLRIEKQACQAANYNDTQVIAAWDMMILPIPQH